MTNKEIADIVDSSAKKILEENKEIITKDLAIDLHFTITA